MWLVKLALLPADRLVLVPIGPLWIAVFFVEIDVPLASNVSMLQKHGPQFLVIFGPRLNWAPETALAPMADRA